MTNTESKAKVLKYSRTTKGLVTAIYSQQRRNSRKRNHPNPTYTNKQLYEWIVLQPNFNTTYNNWVNSNYETNLRPSCDRIKSILPYTLNNLQLVTWEENNNNAKEERKKGKLITSQCKAIIGTSIKTKESVEFYSTMQAERELGVSNSSITQTCKGNVRQAGGYYWKYKNPTD